MNKLSAVIITFNEEKNIGRCIDSLLPVADEVVVLDSFSNDRTTAIASQKGAVVYQQSFAGYFQQKNKAFQLASHNYILSLDADEVLSAELADSILKEKAALGNTAYQMNRCNIYCGRPIKRGLWYPDKKIRLFDKRIGYCGGLNPHDRIILPEKTTVKHLKGDLLHYTYNSADEYLERNEEVSTTAALSLFNSGKKIFWIKQLTSPAWTFINGYILKKGFLDGQTGWTIAVNTTRQSFQKYYKLRQLQNSAEQKTGLQQMKTDFSS
jgi:glycosyltransferase involved in cell wall biosynthesis